MSPAIQSSKTMKTPTIEALKSAFEPNVQKENSKEKTTPKN
jgi:hypothetical protein